MATLLGDFLFAKAGEMCTETGSLLAVRRFTQTLEIISTGEIIQADSAFRIDQRYEDYIQRISYKTASLFALSTETGAILSGAPERAIKELQEYGHNMGIAFQIVDDVLDYTSTVEEMGKPIASDLNQGTLTLPAMVLLARYPKDNPIRRLFDHHQDLSNTERQELTQWVVGMARESNIADECLRYAEDYSARAVAHLAELPACLARKALEDLAAYLITRRT
jgi:geranylgeranyl pyrophosphate synthase